MQCHTQSLCCEHISAITSNFSSTSVQLMDMAIFVLVELWTQSRIKLTPRVNPLLWHFLRLSFERFSVIKYILLTDKHVSVRKQQRYSKWHTLTAQIFNHSLNFIFYKAGSFRYLCVQMFSTVIPVSTAPLSIFLCRNYFTQVFVHQRTCSSSRALSTHASWFASLPASLPSSPVLVSQFLPSLRFISCSVCHLQPP